MARTPGLHQGFGGGERGAGDAGSVRRLVATEQHKVNTAIGQRLQALGGGTDVAAQGGAHVALQQGFGSAGVAVDQPAGPRRRRNGAALGLLGQPLKRSWQTLGCAPGREMGLEIGELRQVGAKLNGSETATQKGMQQGPSSDGGGAS